MDELWWVIEGWLRQRHWVDVQLQDAFWITNVSANGLKLKHLRGQGQCVEQSLLAALGKGERKIPSGAMTQLFRAALAKAVTRRVRFYQHRPGVFQVTWGNSAGDFYDSADSIRGCLEKLERGEARSLSGVTAGSSFEEDVARMLAIIVRFDPNPAPWKKIRHEFLGGEECRTSYPRHVLYELIRRSLILEVSPKGSPFRKKLFKADQLG